MALILHHSHKMNSQRRGLETAFQDTSSVDVLINKERVFFCSIDTSIVQRFLKVFCGQFTSLKGVFVKSGCSSLSQDIRSRQMVWIATVLAHVTFLQILFVYSVNANQTCEKVFANSVVHENSLSKSSQVISPLRFSPESGGLPIKRLRINYHPNQMGKEILKDFLNLMNWLPEARLSIVVANKYFNGLRNFLNMNAIPTSVLNRIDLLKFPHDIDSIWAQDASKPLKDGSILFYPLLEKIKYENSVSTDYEKIDAITKSISKHGVPIRVSHLPFEGGNIVVGEKETFVGFDTIRSYMDSFDVSQFRAEMAYREAFGPLRIVGSTAEEDDRLTQPVFHLDMFLALAKSPNTFKEVVILNSPRLMMREISQKGESYVEIANLQQKGLDEVRLQFLKWGYEVFEVPGFYDTDKSEINRSYTNSVLSGKIAAVPSYRDPELDNRAYDVYRSLGFSVVPMPSSALSITREGAIRCLVEMHR